MAVAVDHEQELVQMAARFHSDPLGFAQFMYPWSDAATPLAKMVGPQAWQAEVLLEVGAAIRSPNMKGRIAIASGKGIGKSALICLIAQWALCTCANTKVVLTAGTEPQLRTKTMTEMAKWFELLLCKHWFKFTATSIYVAEPDPEKQKQWRLDAIPWNANNPEAFAGLHNQGRRIVVLFDEASQIADPIWDTTDGIFSDKDTEVIWICFGNPTRGDGRFRETSSSPRWKFKSIDSRTVSVTDKEELAELVKEEGEDSDYVRVNVRGLFPRVSSMQFIANEAVIEARQRLVDTHLSDPLIFGVDVARFGSNKSIIAVRKGRDCRTIPWKIMAGADTVEVANAVAQMHEMYRADAIHVDEAGVGGGVVDMLRRMNVPVRGVQAGAKSDRANFAIDATNYANKRTEMWGNMREELPRLALPDWDDLQREMVSALYGYRNDRDIQLVTKEIMMRQHKVPSPDLADALALTFAYPVQALPKGQMGGGPYNTNTTTFKASTEYDPYAMQDA